MMNFMTIFIDINRKNIVLKTRDVGLLYSRFQVYLIIEYITVVDVSNFNSTINHFKKII